MEVIILKKQTKLGMVAHACNPSTRRLRHKDWELVASLGYIVRPCQREREREKKRERESYALLLFSW
jgi:hypothetical protein